MIKKPYYFLTLIRDGPPSVSSHVSTILRSTIWFYVICTYVTRFNDFPLFQNARKSSFLEITLRRSFRFRKSGRNNWLAV